MRPFLTSLALASLSLASLVGGAGCAAPTEADVEDDSSAVTSDPRASLGSDAQSLTLSEDGKDTTFGAPKKIKAALASLDGRLKELAGAPRCGPPRLSLTVSGAAAKKLATVDVCGEAQAFLHVGAKWYEAPFAEAALRKALGDKALMGDVLVDATDVAIGNTAGVGSRHSAAPYKKGFDLDAAPAARAASEVPRCMPLMTLRFSKGTAAVADVAVFCPKNENDTVAPASVTVKGALVGWVTFDLAAALGGGF
ncbi:MAG TPA: hypothetical protein VLT33_25245 [Labilithrix sp.]|nr:hypothetical protein [Labilithrix sp.]